MPELPEVESIRLVLERRLVGRVVKKCPFVRLKPWNPASERMLSHIFHPFNEAKMSVLLGVSQKAYVRAYEASLRYFFKHIEGKVFSQIRRSGKYLLFYFTSLHRTEQSSKNDAITTPKARSVQKETQHTKIQDTEAKFLSSGECLLVVHLKMAGQLLIVEPGEINRSDHVHLMMVFERMSKKRRIGIKQESQWLLYRDTRFGELLPIFEKSYLNELFGVEKSRNLERHVRISAPLKMAFSKRQRAVFETLYLAVVKRLARVGVDPYYEVKARVYKVIAAAVMKYSDKALYDFLMDGSYLAGIGNIYANEISHLTGLAPLRKMRLLTEKEQRELTTHLRYVLKGAVASHGTSLDKSISNKNSRINGKQAVSFKKSTHFRLPDGMPGTYARTLRVYGRAGLQCLRKQCRGKIVKQRHAGRSLYFCPQCQY
ncbi:hypothetical protein COTS27_01628 [Spirochaetota bacterium]|nr:hypothetical protein COTS27_01628 [Spirochaetota bacterium]